MESEKNPFSSPEMKEYMKQLGKKGASSRWAGHKKISEEDKKAQKAQYAREYRKRQKESK